MRNVPLIAKLQGQYAVFGRVVKGMDVVHRRPSATRY
ncbi:MAG: peptidylprolyl isomerase [Bacillota bacterium]